MIKTGPVIFRVKNKDLTTKEDISRVRKNFPKGGFEVQSTHIEVGNNGFWSGSEDIRFLVADGELFNKRVFGIKLAVTPNLAINIDLHKDAYKKYVKYFFRLFQKMVIGINKSEPLTVTIEQYFKSEKAFYKGKRPKLAYIYVNKNEDSTAPDFKWKDDGLFEFWVKPVEN